VFTSFNFSRRSRGFTLVELPVVSARKRAAFTLVELLVVITIIGALAALLLPAVLGSSDAARRSQCANHMRNLAQAMTAYETAKGQLPGYSQPIKRSPTQAVGIKRLSDPPRWVLTTVPLNEALPISWATMLLPRIERQDIWDQIVDLNFEPEIRRLDLLICPADRDAKESAELAALSYSVNAGAPDWDGRFLLDAADPNIGDSPDNGMFLNLYEYAAKKMKAPSTRLGKVRDGAATTIMLSENIHKSYEPASPGFPSRFTWAFGTEQHLGIVWVVSYPPQPGDTFVDQERINYASSSVYSRNPVFDPNTPRFARPASAHPNGVNVAFCDGHTDFVRDDIDYAIYQQLLTAHGKNCVDPRNHNAGVKPPDPSHPIYKFRKSPPLSERDYQ
jgi:prepilin-type N-terminal cleavage/methylation domain-containing protein/prepilin-type processing-associated H-X9-DG protein